MIFITKKRYYSFFAILLLFCCHAQAKDTLTFSQRKDVKKYIDATVKKYPFTRKELVEVLDDVKVQPRIIKAITTPYEQKPWDIYQKSFLSPKRISQGVDFWLKHQSTLEKIEKQYGVPANIIVAILGVETSYGKIQGKHRVLDALATLAFEYPRRASFFSRELTQYLLLCKEQGVAPNTILGSYAGAIGQPQFMPSSYRHYAVDYSGNGKKDLRGDTNDVMASVANYFKRHGWKNKQAVTQPATFNGDQYKSINTRARKATLPLNTLSTLGVEIQSTTGPSPKRAGLIRLNTSDNQPQYWVAYPNFYVITRYNTSKQYAMAVFQLSEKLKQRKLALINKPTKRA